MVGYIGRSYPYTLYDYTSSTSDGTAEASVRHSCYGHVSTTQTNVSAVIIEILIKPEEVFYITLFLILLELHLIIEVFAYMIRAPPVVIKIIDQNCEQRAVCFTNKWLWRQIPPGLHRRYNMIYSQLVHYEVDRKYASACGKYGVGDYTTDIEKITCKSCARFVRSKRNKDMVEERARRAADGKN